MKNLKRFTAIIIALLMMANLVACSGSGDKDESTTDSKDNTTASEDNNTDSSTAEQVNLRFMWWGGDERAQATLDVIKQFEEENPGITVSAESLSSDGYQEKLTTQLSAGTAADIIQMGTGWMPGYVKSGANYFADFNEYGDVIDLSDFNADFLKNNGNFDGKQLGVPTGYGASALIYNTELAEKIGIEFTEDLTWDDLIEMGKKVKAYDPNMYLLTVGDSLLSNCILRPYMQQLTGNTFFVDDTIEMGFTKDQLVQGLDYIKALYDNNVIAPISSVISYGDELQTDPKWISGDTYVGMYAFSSTANVAAAACPDATFAATSLPIMEGALDDGYYSSGPQYMVVNNKSEHVKEAMMFLNYFYNNEKAAETLGTVRSVPPTATAQEICAESGLIDPLTKATVDICQKYSGKSDLGLTTEEEATTMLKDMIDEVAYGVSTPEDAATSSMVLFQNYLDLKKSN